MAFAIALSYVPNRYLPLGIRAGGGLPLHDERPRPALLRIQPCTVSMGIKGRKMKAREACAESPYQAAVRYTDDGRPMIFGQPHGRAFLQTLSETGRPVFQEVKRKYVENVLNYTDWKPWTGPDP
jgi:hypothetical protein